MRPPSATLESPARLGAIMSWIDDPWMGFDTETTGVRALKDRLVTAAFIIVISI